MFEVIDGGFKTSVQDCGRVGWMSAGIPPSGAFDNFSLRMGNLLVGNNVGSVPIVGSEPGDAGLEIILFGLKLRALKETVIAVTGANLSPTINGEPLQMWKALRVNSDDVIAFGGARVGCRAYLTVAGGIEVPPVLESKSTYVEMGGSLGGLDGRPLKKGDILRIGQPNAPLDRLEGRTVKANAIPEYLTTRRDVLEVRVVLGPQDHLFTEEAVEAFLKSQWAVNPNSDRAGYRYIGPALKYKPKPQDLVKETGQEPSNTACDGNIPGSIQVPGGVEPIVIGVDGPSFGCFAKIATVILADLGKVAQSKPRDNTRFKEVTLDEAVSILEKNERLLTEGNIT